jgi:hypothetical protein
MSDAVQTYEGDGEVPEGTTSQWEPPTQAKYEFQLYLAAKLNDATKRHLDDLAERVAEFNRQQGQVPFAVRAVLERVGKVMIEFETALAKADTAQREAEEQYNWRRNGSTGYLNPPSTPFETEGSRVRSEAFGAAFDRSLRNDCSGMTHEIRMLVGDLRSLGCQL